MRAYFFGDIHGNSYALEACLKHLEGLRVDEAYCLGDLAGWLPFGDRILTRMRSLELPTVAGNHDLLIAGLFPDHPHQVDRMQATAYNMGLLSTMPSALEYLSNLPLLIERQDFVVVHHSPFHLPPPGETPDIECFNYLDEVALTGCLKAWRDTPLRLIFSGHDHIPAVYEISDGAESPRLEDVNIHTPPPDEALTISIHPRCRYWIKAGSVGGPYRDSVPLANSVLYDSDSQTITLYRIPFPTDRLHQDMASHPFCRNLPTLHRYMELLTQ
jgi:hypothetical protein